MVFNPFDQLSDKKAKSYDNFPNILLFQTREEDANRDGKPDMLHYNIEVPLLDLEQVYSAKLILIFDYRLYVSSSWSIWCCIL